MTDLQTSPKAMQLKTHFLCFNLKSASPVYFDHLKIAVNSCKHNTSLKTYCIFTGEKNHIYNWLESRGVILICANKREIVNQITIAGSKCPIFRTHVALGVWLRIEIPNICLEQNIHDSHILYTDVDVLFTEKFKDGTLNESIPKFACAREGDSKAFYNSGVMIINNEYMRKTYDSFISFVYKRGIENFNRSFDQEALNEFYPISTITRLSRRKWNWTPYMNNGKLTDRYAKIIHFHGPKLDNIKSSNRFYCRMKNIFLHFQDKILHKKVDKIEMLFNRSPDRYYKLLYTAKKYLS